MVKGKLEVFLAEGRDIKDRDFMFLDCLCSLVPWNPIKVHPYVVIQCGNQELTSDVARIDGNKLIWNQKLIYDLEYLDDENELYEKLVLRVIDKNKISNDDYIGEATVYIKDVLSWGKENGSARLGTQKYRVVSPDTTYSGEISIAVTFTRDDVVN